MTVSKVFVLAAAVATVGLSGCAPILIGGAAVTSATVITDRRTTGSIVDDEVLEKRVRYEIGEVIGHEKHHVVVTSYEGKVLLTAVSWAFCLSAAVSTSPVRSTLPS